MQEDINNKNIQEENLMSQNDISNILDFIALNRLFKSNFFKFIKFIKILILCVMIIFMFVFGKKMLQSQGKYFYYITNIGLSAFDKKFSQNIGNINFAIQGNKILKDTFILEKIYSSNIKKINFLTLKHIYDILMQIAFIENVVVKKGIDNNISIIVKEKTFIGILNYTTTPFKEEFKSLDIGQMIYDNKMQNSNNNLENKSGLLTNDGQIIDLNNGIMDKISLENIITINHLIDIMGFIDFYKTINNIDAFVQNIKQINITSSGNYDIYLKNDIIIKMPYDNYMSNIDSLRNILHKFINIEDDKLTAIEYIDFRIKGKILIGKR